jgi:putative membrane protein
VARRLRWLPATYFFLEDRMPSTLGRHCLLALAASGMLMACTARDTNTDTTSAAGAVATSNDSAARAASTNNGWTDGRIVGFATAANAGEIAEGKLAQTKATNAQVKAFAKQLVTDHQAMLDEGKQFATSNNVMPDTTSSDVTDLMHESQEELKDLQEKKAGKDWDKDFIEHEIEGHKKVLDKLQQAAQSTTNQQLKDMLTKASGKVQEHLTKAQDLENTLKS